MFTIPNRHGMTLLPSLLLALSLACGPTPADEGTTGAADTTSGTSGLDLTTTASGSAGSSAVPTGDDPTTGADTDVVLATSSSSTEPAQTSTSSDVTGDAGDASASTSSGDGGDSTATTGHDESTGDVPEVVPLCFGDPCDGVCGPGLVCLPHPTTGEGMCVTQCLASPTCEGVVSALCGEGPTLKVPNTACIFNACFPRTCLALADCPNTSTECTKGICF